MALTIPNKGAFVPGGSSTTHTFSVTIGAGTNRKLIVALAQETTIALNAITFDGTSFLSNLPAGADIINATDGNCRARIFYYDIPDITGAGNYDVVFTVASTTANFSAHWWQLLGAATGAPEDAQETGWTTTSTNGTVTLTCTDGAAVLGVAITTAGTQTWTISGSVTEDTESNEANYTSVGASAVVVGSGSKTMTATVNTTSAGNKVLTAVSVAEFVATGPTITVQPTAQTKVLTNANTATFSCTATGTGTVNLTAEIETAPASGSYVDLANGSGATWTGLTGTGSGSASITLVGTFTAKTQTGKRIRIEAVDSNGTTYSNAVLLTLFDGPQVTTFPATDGSGESTATLTSDYVTGVGEAIEVRIPLSDGDVAVTVTTT